ncbi:MAG: hypothetical protein KGL92_14940 [Gammaproteobacteria bacterium]|nr:hypothetical protein [Gammaproteobacteria bacterium]
MSAARTRQSHAPPFIDPPGYGRHRPERTLLYQLVEQHYPAFRELRNAAERPLPDFVQREFDAYLKCGRAGAEQSQRELALVARGPPAQVRLL